MATSRSLDVIKHCCLVGADLERADLRYKDLRGVNLTNSNLRGADLSHSDCRGTLFVKADLSRACLYNTDCEGADFSHADMSMSYLRATNFNHARMWFAALRRVTCKQAFFLGADMTGVDFAFGFFLGSRFGPPMAIVKGARNIDLATFHWYWNPQGGAPSYKPVEGYLDLWDSALGGISMQENASTRPK